jgi:hypothetical protein
LNLDGGRSTAFYARTNDGREISQPGWSTVRNYVAVVPREGSDVATEKDEFKVRL